MTISSKDSIRKAVLARRQAIAPQQRLAWSQACADRLSVFIESLGETRLSVAGYVAIKNEPDIMAALAALSTRHIIALPAVIPSVKVLSFRQFSPGDTLREGAYGIKAPLPKANEVIPDVVIVPVAAFDRSGHRLGYGGGYYDATLNSFRHARDILAIGVAFSLQEVDAIPAESFDARMHAVVTEKEMIRIA